MAIVRSTSAGNAAAGNAAAGNAATDVVGRALRDGAPLRGVEFSCEASTELDLAAAAADDAAARLAASVADGSAAPVRYYSLGILSDQADLAQHAQEVLGGRGLALTLHPMDLDLAGTDPLDISVLRALRDRARELDAAWVTTDLAMWVRGGEALINNLVPMPLVPEAVDWCVPRICRAQDVIDRPIVIGNAPYPFIVGNTDVLPLMAEIVERTGCLATIDIGHLYGLRRQQGRPLEQPGDDSFCWDHVVEVHLAGLVERVLPGGERVFEDFHTVTISPGVWELAARLVPRARNLRALMAECELMPRADLVHTICRLASALPRWLPGEDPPQERCSDDATCGSRLT
ncbi:MULTISPECIES: DUF692 family multinuclear iron-containing protein [unclassified Frankia]|uniref:multinuclear nonheme iron-dependent oxidase n=1 Tax=unclassified Frankia TaxID=2632575 RepID=UPI002AD3B82D|nr:MULTISPECIES: DUF692 family multinuclear iron-containing protein [unclassified Frankia]